jgi:hypothetical protein
MAIPHRLRLPGHFQFDRTAKACAGIDFAHENSPPSWRLPDVAGHARERQVKASTLWI